MQEDDDPDYNPDDEVEAWLARTPRGVAPEWDALVAALGRRPRRIAVAGGRWVLIARRPARAGEVSTADDGASFIEREVGLAEHCGDVRGWTEAFAHRLALPSELASDLALAAWLHDVGKADPRFQCMLVGGSEVRLAALAAPIAKSALPQTDARAREQARRRAGYPRGYRHEILSIAMAQGSAGALDAARDGDLVLHLVGSHHGWCRPFAPALDDPMDLPVALDHGSMTLASGTRHRLARLDSGVCDRFWGLVGRYGWWGLAWLETVLRLADHRASEARGEPGR